MTSESERLDLIAEHAANNQFALSDAAWKKMRARNLKRVRISSPVQREDPIEEPDDRSPEELYFDALTPSEWLELFAPLTAVQLRGLTKSHVAYVESLSGAARLKGCHLSVDLTFPDVEEPVVIGQCKTCPSQDCRRCPWCDPANFSKGLAAYMQRVWRAIQRGAANPSIAGRPHKTPSAHMVSTAERLREDGISDRDIARELHIGLVYLHRFLPSRGHHNHPAGRSNWSRGQQKAEWVRRLRVSQRDAISGGHAPRLPEGLVPTRGPRNVESGQIAALQEARRARRHREAR